MKKLLLVALVTAAGLAYRQGWFSPQAVDPHSQVYKFQDSQGHWHFTDSKPQVATVETLQLSNQQNILPAPGKMEWSEKTLAAETTGLWDKILFYVNTLGRGDSVIQQAEQVQQKSQARQEAMEKL